AAVASAAKPDADDAIPAAVGPSLVETTLARAPAVSRPASAAKERTRSKKVVVRRVALASAMVPLSSKVSWPVVSSTLVVVANWSSVIDIDPATGMISSSSALPQYLTRAMLGWARAMDATSRPHRQYVRSVRTSRQNHCESTTSSWCGSRPPRSWQLRRHRLVLGLVQRPTHSHLVLIR